ncbi:hypothetical protein ACIEGK_28030 [Citrobacter freundii]|uniref:hypothetical protein n=1 Tax=Citrobacter freundii complex TaxID=1344959 RepID=UPI0037CA15CA
MVTADTDPRWQALSDKYQGNWTLAMKDLFGIEATHQQEKVLLSAEVKSSSTSVAVATNGVGYIELVAVITILRTILYRDSRVIITGYGISQTYLHIMRRIECLWKKILKTEPWLDNYFELKISKLQARTNKHLWQCKSVSYRTGKEENLAGECSENLMFIVLDASRMPERGLGTIRGTLTNSDNRILLISIPDKNKGHFYDSQHEKLAIGPNNPRGIYTAITLSAEDSPLVHPAYLDKKQKEYGGRDSRDYRIKILAQFVED